MPRQRADDCSSRTLPLLTTNACLSITRFVRGLDFLIGSIPGFFARQNFFTGQTLHFGLSGRQTRAPRSISAELKRAALRFGTNCAANAQSFSRPIAESMGGRLSSNGVRTRELC